MNNRCIVEQLGYNLNDKRVFIDCDDYIDVKLDDNLFVGANTDCTSIIVHTYNVTMLDIDLEDSNNIILTIPIIRKGASNVTERGIIQETYDYYDVKIVLNENGIDEYIKEQYVTKKELLFHKDKNECTINDILDIITYAMVNDDNISNNSNMKKLLNIVVKAIKPMIEDYLKKNNNEILRKK